MKKKTVPGRKGGRVSPKSRKASTASKPRKTTARKARKLVRDETVPARHSQSFAARSRPEKQDLELGTRPPTRKKPATSTLISSQSAKPLTSPPAPRSPLDELKIPGLLLEGDEPLQFFIPPVRGTRQPGPWPAPVVSPSDESRDLPDAYGTGELLLSARDPHWLYAHWDLPRESQRHYNSLSSDGHLVLRTFLESALQEPVSELRVHPESQHWFVHVQGAGKKYVSELGYYGAKREWLTITASAAISTPPDAPSSDASISFAALGWARESQSVASEMPGDRGLAVVPEPPHSSPEFKDEWHPVAPQTRVGPADSRAAEALDLTGTTTAVSGPRGVITPGSPISDDQTSTIPLMATSALTSHLFTSTTTDVPPPGLGSPLSKGATPMAARISEEPSVKPSAGASVSPGMPMADEIWTSSHERALLELIYGLQHTSAHETERVLGFPTPGSVSSAEYAPQQPIRLDLPPAGFLGWPAAGISSPGAPPTTAGALPYGREGDFWMNVNAELVIYGATEPTAAVSLGGRRIRLRPDGTFSYRFSLPDGAYELEVKAISSAGDTRAARLGFSRSTHKAGAIAAHPQEPGLRPPVPESI